MYVLSYTLVSFDSDCSNPYLEPFQIKLLASDYVSALAEALAYLGSIHAQDGCAVSDVRLCLVS